MTEICDTEQDHTNSLLGAVSMLSLKPFMMLSSTLSAKLAAFIARVVRVPSAEIDEWLAQLSTQAVPKGHRVVRPGQVGDFLCYVEAGALRTYLTLDEREVNTEFFLEDSFAGTYTSFLLGTPTALTLEALEACSLVYVTKAAFDQACDRNPAWLALGKQLVEAEFVKKCRRETAFLQDSAARRYQALLREHPHLEARIPLFHIASYLGIQPESLSRIRSSVYPAN